MKVEFFGQSTRDSDYLAATSARLVNLYREPLLPGAKSGYVLKSVPGLMPFSGLPGVFVRAVESIDSRFFAVAGGRLQQIMANGGNFDRGAIPDDEKTTISGNNGDVTVVAGGNYYRWDGASLTEPTTGAFTDFGSHDYIGNYTVLSELNGRRFQWSDVADANTLPGTNFSTADGRDDNIVRVASINGVLYIFTESSHEVWYLTGAAGAAAFERQAGGVQDLGLKSHNLFAKLPGGAFFVGSDGKAYLMSGAQQPVSTPAVETAIRGCDPRSCFVYEDEGHTFCVITFLECAAWVYDVSLGEWHERAEGALLSPWTASCSAKFGADWVCGRDDGTLLKFAAIGTDNDGVLVREATSRTIYQDGQRFIVNEFELFPRRGLGGTDVATEISRDGGMTWTDPKVRSLGPSGDFAGRIMWRSLGQCRQFTARVRYSAPSTFAMLAEGRAA